MKKLFTFFTCALMLIATATVYGQSTVSINPEKDNTLFESPTGTLSAGAEPNLFSGRLSNTGGGLLRRAVLMFDVAAAIPSGSLITGASLTLQATQATIGTDNFTLHVLTADWGEAGSTGSGAGGGQGGAAQTGDATWIHTFYDTGFWISPGGDFVATPSATTPVGGLGSYTWTSTQLATDVQAWLDNPGSNFGWILIGNESTLQTAKRFASRENSTPSFMPTLTINYTAPCTAPDIPTLNVSGTPGCPGEPVNIIVTGNLNDATEWALYTDSCGGTPLLTSAAGIFTVSPTTTTTYYVRGEGGCVTPGACANIGITPFQTDTSVTQSMGTLTAVTSASTYQWLDCDYNFAPVPGETSQSFSPTISGNYAVTFTDNNGCIDTSSCHEVIINNINENNAETLANVYPNPFHNELFLNYAGKISDMIQLQIINSIGQTICIIAYTENTRINTTAFPAGVYLLRLAERKNNKILYEQTIVKQ